MEYRRCYCKLHATIGSNRTRRESCLLFVWFLLISCSSTRLQKGLVRSGRFRRGAGVGQIGPVILSAAKNQPPYHHAPHPILRCAQNDRAAFVLVCGYFCRNRREHPPGGMRTTNRLV